MVKYSERKGFKRRGNMNILIVGAGAIGGYFGARLIEKGENVTFLVRERRKNELETYGLMVESPHGNVTVQPKTILTGDPLENVDVILLATKAYHLEQAIHDIRPYIGEKTLILPLLNGMAHLNILIENFGDEKVIGGLCFIESTLGENGKVIQKSKVHDLLFGERNGVETERIKQLREKFAGTKANFRYSNKILADMWAKYLFISVFSGVTTIFRAPIGPILETEEGDEAVATLMEEVVSIMKKMGAPIDDDVKEEQLAKIKQMEKTMKSSMQRDMEKGLPTEGDHFFKYLLKNGEKHGVNAPYIKWIYTNLKIYEKSMFV